MLTAILISGLLLRLIKLDQSLWLDEGTTALVARDLNWSQFFGNFLPNDFHPPLYYFVIKLTTNLFGNYSEIFLRMPGVLFGTVTIFFIFKIGETIKDRRLGLVSSLLMATASLHIYYSQEARMYALALLFVTVAVYAHLRNSRWLFIFSLSAAFWTDYLTIFMLPVFLLHKRESLKNIFISCALCLPMLSFLPAQLSRGLSQEGSNWWHILGQTNLKNIGLIPVKFVLGRISFPKPFYQIIFLGAGSIFGILFFSAFKKRSVPSVVWLWLLIPVFAGIVIGLFVPVLSYFRFLFVLPAFYLLTALGITSLPKAYQSLVLGVVVSLNMIFSGIYLFNPKFHREDWRAFARVSKNSVVVFPGSSQKEAYNYYVASNNILGVQEINNEVSELWLVRYVYDIVDPNDTTRKQIEELGYEKIAEYNFNGVVVFKYKQSSAK